MGSQVPSACPVMCGIQCKIKKMYFILYKKYEIFDKMLNFTANQETIVELIGFAHRVAGGGVRRAGPEPPRPPTSASLLSMPTADEHVKVTFVCYYKIIYFINFFNSFTLYPTHSRVGRGNLVLRHSVSEFLPNFGGIAC